MRFVVLASLLAAMSACSPGPAPVARAADDPSNPDAPESRDPVRPAERTSSSSDAGSVVYACPMHPEVTSTTPERCPKCGMALVPRR